MAEGQRGRGAEGQRRKEIKMFFYEQKHNNSERAAISPGCVSNSVATGD